MRTVSFTRRPQENVVAPPTSTIDVTGQFYDLKSSVQYMIHASMPKTFVLHNSSVQVDAAALSSRSNTTHKTLPLYMRPTTDGFIGFTAHGDISVNGCDLRYEFIDLQTYKITYSVTIIDTTDVNNYVYHTYDHHQIFKFFSSPVTLTPFDFDDNIARGDDIYITGLNLHLAAGLLEDTTRPEALNPSGLPIVNTTGLSINNKGQLVDSNNVIIYPYVMPAIQFYFQDATDSGTNNYYESDEVYIAQILAYNPDGNYTLKANSLTNGKKYVVTATAFWADGYMTSVTSTFTLYVINRPVISSAIDVKNVYINESDETVVTINVARETGQVSDKIWFNFYKSGTTTLVARAGGASGFALVNTNETNSYSLKLSELQSQNGLYLNNNDEYYVKAQTLFNGPSGFDRTTQIRFSDSKNVSFTKVYPAIASNGVTAYDIQDEEVDASLSEQMAATISVDVSGYKLFAPNQLNGIKFNLYNANSIKVASTKQYTFLNDKLESTSLYDIKLKDFTLESGQSVLTNGTPYKIDVEVTLRNHAGTNEQRLSLTKRDITFSQNTAPISNLVVSNTWELATNFNPSSSTSNFNNSPLIGISGHFKKTAQFNSAFGTSQLDTDKTKFKLEYKVAGNTVYNIVKRAVLIQKISTETLQDAVNRARNLTVTERSNGEYDNIVGSIIGTQQEPLVFYIPQIQVDANGNAFNENNIVTVQVTLMDTAGVTEGDGSIETVAPSFQLINKINSYSFTPATSSEPWNTIETNKLYINIPVNWDSIHAHSVKVGYKYAVGDSYTYVTYMYNNPLQVKTDSNNADESTKRYVSLEVNPVSGTTLYYNVAYVVSNVNRSPTTQGLTLEVNVPNRSFPQSSDYSIVSDSYKTFNNGGESSIDFTLNLSVDNTRQLDGIDVFFTSPNSSIGSNIIKTRIQSFLASELAGSSGVQKNVTLILSQGRLRVMNDTGILSDGPVWGDYDIADISFEAFRHNRVVTRITDINNSYSSTHYSKSGVNNFSQSIWNVPLLSKPSANGSIILTGGVINSSSPSKITWVPVNDSNNVPFTYDVKLIMNDNTTTLKQNTANNSGPTLDLNIDTSAVAKYNVEIIKVFNGLLPSREISLIDTIEFYSIHVDTSSMNISVNRPSNATSVTLSWAEPVVTGTSNDQSVPNNVSSFSKNIHTRRMQYSKVVPPIPSSIVWGVNSILNPSGSLIESGPMLTYTLPSNTLLGTLFKFNMYIKAHVYYTVNANTAIVSTAVDVPETSETTKNKYIVSTVPAATVAADTPVLTNLAPTKPTLLLNLDAKGLENEGFISVMVILTQDGTEMRPEGASAMVVFPPPPAVANFLKDESGNNFLVGDGNIQPNGDGADVKLVGGDSSESAPSNIVNAPISLHSNIYKLTVGTPGASGRYGLSTLEMPLSVQSGFQDSGQVGTAGFNPVNYMVVVTTRRGCDFAVGDFIYRAVPTVNNVNITTDNGNYFVNFTLGSS